MENLKKEADMIQRQIILDTETTGLYADGGDRLVEFAGLEMVNRQMTDKNLHLYVHPERDMPEEAARVHGLTIEVLEGKNAPPFAEVGRQIADFLRGAELIIHNAKFDVGFLNMEFRRMGLPTVEELGCTVTDTLAMAREMFPGQKASLDALCNRFSVDRSKRVLHGALIDCELLGEVYLAMTRRQFDLMGAVAEEKMETKPVAHTETKRSGKLKVIRADENELAEHGQYLDGLGESCIWRKTQMPSENGGTDA
ncbi:DNA polymerase III, epsilon subunit [Neisseria polysaccharea ATCC 43768]|nr:DNA polymerase III, epsilon subunit [Neisseria polysaccharea ATCC 43768]